MLFRYETFGVDVTPKFSRGRYFSRVKIEPCRDLSQAGPDEEYESGDLGDFASEADAIAYARKWAIDWINERISPVVCRNTKD